MGWRKKENSCFLRITKVAIPSSERGEVYFEKGASLKHAWFRKQTWKRKKKFQTTMISFKGLITFSFCVPWRWDGKRKEKKTFCLYFYFSNCKQVWCLTPPFSWAGIRSLSPQMFWVARKMDYKTRRLFRSETFNFWSCVKESCLKSAFSLVSWLSPTPQASKSKPWNRVPKPSKLPKLERKFVNARAMKKRNVSERWNNKSKDASTTAGPSLKR